MFTFLKTWFGSSTSSQPKNPARRPATLTGRLRVENLESRLSPSALGLGSIGTLPPPIDPGIPAHLATH